MKIILTWMQVVLAFAVNAQTSPASIKDLAFMSGTWTQQHEWGEMEEYWSSPQGNCMTSNFRCVKNDAVLFYEFMVIEQDASGPVLKLRHFDPGSIGWEDNKSPWILPLNSLEGQMAVFETSDATVRITYKVEPGKRMQIKLEEKDKEGKLTTTNFDMRRANQ